MALEAGGLRSGRIAPARVIGTNHHRITDPIHETGRIRGTDRNRETDRIRRSAFSDEEWFGWNFTTGAAGCSAVQIAKILTATARYRF